MRSFFEKVVLAVIMAFGLSLAGYFAGGRFSMEAVSQDGDHIAWRMDRFTGEVSLCHARQGGMNAPSAECVPVFDAGAPWKEVELPRSLSGKQAP
ncbi:hypothetical protein [Novosphingobium indicum]|uniref:hypothetical protein n=1 Tax=Novosphingobium indicum TaxID=462949 RepID=UPI001669ECD5|nr:hypothetical protein [Novosphingobium indicum]